MLAPAAAMLCDQPTERARAENTPARKAVAEQVGLEFPRESPGQPFAQRHDESLLAATDNCRRQVTRRQPLQQELVRRAANLELPVESRAKLDKTVIKIRHARLERVRHRRAIDLGQEVVGQPQTRV